MNKIKYSYSNSKKLEKFQSLRHFQLFNSILNSTSICQKIFPIFNKIKNQKNLVCVCVCVRACTCVLTQLPLKYFVSFIHDQTHHNHPLISATGSYFIYCSKLSPGTHSFTLSLLKTRCFKIPSMFPPLHPHTISFEMR